MAQNKKPWSFGATERIEKNLRVKKENGVVYTIHTNIVIVVVVVVVVARARGFKGNRSGFFKTGSINDGVPP